MGIARATLNPTPNNWDGGYFKNPMQLPMGFNVISSTYKTTAAHWKKALKRGLCAHRTLLYCLIPTEEKNNAEKSTF